MGRSDFGFNDAAMFLGDGGKFGHVIHSDHLARSTQRYYRLFRYQSQQNRNTFEAKHNFVIEVNAILRLICDGLEYDEIAHKLGIAGRTVKYHVSNILSKTGYANRTRFAIAVTNKKFIVPNLPEEQAFSTTE